MKLSKTIYNYQDSKKIYFSNTASKYYLFEKKDFAPVYICQLLKRNPVVSYSKTGVVIQFEKNR